MVLQEFGLPFTVGNPFRKQALVQEIKKALTTVEKVDRMIFDSDGKATGWRLYGTDAAFCYRKAALYNAAPRRHSTSASAKFYMASGKAAEEVIIDAFFRMGKLMFKDYRVPEAGVNVGGKIDLIFYWEGGVWGGEVKECGKLPEEPRPEHKAQAGCYSVLTGLPFKIIYVSRDAAIPGPEQDLAIRIFDLDTSQEELLKYATNIGMSYVYSEAKVLAPKPPWIFKSKHCTYCAFKQMCWGSEPFPTMLPTPELERELSLRAEAIGRQLMDTRTNRRTGVLKFFQDNGNEFTKKLLKDSNWADFFDD